MHARSRRLSPILATLLSVSAALTAWPAVTFVETGATPLTLGDTRRDGDDAFALTDCPDQRERDGQHADFWPS